MNRGTTPVRCDSVCPHLTGTQGGITKAPDTAPVRREMASTQQAAKGVAIFRQLYSLADYQGDDITFKTTY